MMCKVFFSILVVIVVFFSAVFSAQAAEKYVNDDLGISLVIPEEWKSLESVHHNALVEFRRGKANIPAFGMFVVGVTQKSAVKSALDYAMDFVGQSRQDPNTAILEEPHEVVINTIPMTAFLIESKEPAFKTAFFQFMSGQDIISLYAVYEFGNQQERMLEILKSIQLEDAGHSFRNLFLVKAVSPEFRPLESAEYALLKSEIITALNSGKTLKTRYIVRDLTDESLSGQDFKSYKVNMTFVSPGEFEIEKFYYLDSSSRIWRVVGEKVYEKFKSWAESPDLSFEARIDPRVQKSVSAKKTYYEFFELKKYLQLFMNETPVGIDDTTNSRYIVLDFEPKNLDFLSLDRLDLQPRKGRLWVWVDRGDKTVRIVRLVFRGSDLSGKPVKHKHDHYFHAINGQFQLGTPPL